MAKKSMESLARGYRARRSAKYIPDSKIDFSDIPELTDDELKRMRRVGRPLIGTAQRQLIAIRIDPLLLKKIRQQAKKKNKGYQSLIHEILDKYIKRRAA